MSFAINSIRPPAGIEHIDAVASRKPEGAGGAFQSILSEAVGRVSETQQTAQNTVDRFMAGENEEVHTIALQTQQAELAFDMFMQVRNKVVQAYQEVMRMQM